MKILSIECSSKNLSLAISDNDKLITYTNRKLDKNLSKAIIPAIEKLLTKANLKLEKIDGFAIGLGPGSFTSLRVSMSAVKAFALTQKKPLVGIPSLDLIAMNVSGDTKQLCVIVDARRNMVYNGYYQKKNGSLKRKRKYSLTSIDEVIKNFKGDVTFVGDGISLYKDDILKNKMIAPVFVDQKQWRPQAKHMASLSLDLFKSKKTDNIDKLIPLYLYPDNCQVVRK